MAAKRSLTEDSKSNWPRAFLFQIMLYALERSYSDWYLLISRWSWGNRVMSDSQTSAGASTSSGAGDDASPLSNPGLWVALETGLPNAISLLLLSDWGVLGHSTSTVSTCGVLGRLSFVPEVISKPLVQGGWEELEQEDWADLSEGWEELAQDVLFNCDGTVLVGSLVSVAIYFFSVPGIAQFSWRSLEAK